MSMINSTTRKNPVRRTRKTEFFITINRVLSAAAKRLYCPRHVPQHHPSTRPTEDLTDRDRGGEGRQLRGEGRRVLRLSRPERGGEDHDDQYAGRPGETHQRRDRDRRADAG